MAVYDTLNDRQKEAVFCTEGPLLVLAGAGSGKTRVLTHRIAYLIEEKDVNPWNIMAITFTNKAAGEMRDRVDNLVGFGSESIWVSTFHSSCVRILRRFIDHLGYNTNFSIYDTDDQKTLMRQILKKLELDPKTFRDRAMLSAISSAKNELMSPEEFRVNAEGDWRAKKIAEVYQNYQEELKKNNALDFDDLIFKTVDLFRTNADVLEYYQERFKYIMVDEYQDTNTAQFRLITRTSAWWVTMTSPSISSGEPISAISWTLRVLSRGRRSLSWSRTTVPPATFWTRPTRSSAITRGGKTRLCGRPMARVCR